MAVLQRQLVEVENQLQYGWEAYEALSSQLGESQRRISQLESELAQPRSLVPINQATELQAELDALRKEQEDLLVLLADQDQQLNEYKTQIRQLGGQVSHIIKLCRFLSVKLRGFSLETPMKND